MLDDLATARAAADELAEIASRPPRPRPSARRPTPVRPRSSSRRAAWREAERPPATRERCSREIDLSYEAARISQVLGRIHLARGEPDRARAEHRAALDTFERIGAVLDARAPPPCWRSWRLRPYLRAPHLRRRGR